MLPEDQQQEQEEPVLNETETDASAFADDDESPEAIGHRLAEFTKSAAPKEEAKQKDEKPPSTEKPVAKVEDPKSSDKGKIGKDGMTKEERSALLDYKTKVETAEARIKELEELAKSGDATKAELAELKKREAEWERKYGEKDAELKDAASVERLADIPAKKFGAAKRCRSIVSTTS